jgi:hypothetical protein
VPRLADARHQGEASGKKPRNDGSGGELHGRGVWLRPAQDDGWDRTMHVS